MPQNPINPYDPAAPLREATALLEAQTGATSHTPKEIRDLIVACQKTFEAHGVRAADRRKDILMGVQYVCGTVSLIAIMAFFVIYYPSDKRDLVIDKLIPVLLTALGFLFGRQSVKK